MNRHLILFSLILQVYLMPGSANAQGSGHELWVDLNILMADPMDHFPEEQEKVLNRVRSRPEPYLRLIDEVLVSPPKDSLLAYPEYYTQGRYSSLLRIVYEIGNERARTVLARVYREAARDADMLHPRYTEARKRAKEIHAFLPDFRQIRFASYTAGGLHDLALEYLGKLGDDRVLNHALNRYWRVSESRQFAIKSYSKAVTGSFMPPPKPQDDR